MPSVAYERKMSILVKDKAFLEKQIYELEIVKNHSGFLSSSDESRLQQARRLLIKVLEDLQPPAKKEVKEYPDHALVPERIA